MLNDCALLRRYTDTRDPEAFAELATRYAGLVYGTCLRVLGNPADAEDVAQECFLELARKAHRVRSSLPGWLHALAHSRAVDALRKEATRRQYEGQIPPTDQEDGLSWEEIAPYVDAALAALPDELREPILIHYLQGLTQTEVAARLGTTQATVSRRLDRGIAQLREHLRRAGVVASVALLSAHLHQHAAVAAPAGLMANVGKIALAGVGASTVASANLKIVIGVAIITLLCGAGVLAIRQFTPIGKPAAHDPAPKLALPAITLDPLPPITGTATNHAYVLPSGARVELTWLRRASDNPNVGPWWRPDGTRLDKVPPGNRYGMDQGANTEKVIAVFGISNQNTTEQWMILAKWRDGVKLHNAEGVHYAPTNVAPTLTAADGRALPRSTTIYAGIADTPWVENQRFTHQDASFVCTKQPAQQRFAVQLTKHAVAEPYTTFENDGTKRELPTYEFTLTTTIDEKLSSERRVILITRDGKTLKPCTWHGNDDFTPDGSAVPEESYTFADITPDRIAAISYQVRPRTWVAFPDVALTPSEVEPGN